MFGPQIGFNPQAGIPQVPQGQPMPQNAQTGAVQPSVGPMTPNQMMTPMPMSQRIAGLQDKMELATPMALPQATEDAFPMDKIMAGFGTSFGQLPTAGEVNEQMPQVRQNIQENFAETGYIDKSALKVLLEPLDNNKRQEAIQTLLEMGTKIEGLNYEKPQEPTKFDEARGKVDTLFEGSKPVKIGGVTVADPMRGIKSVASNAIDFAEGVGEARKGRQAKIDDIVMAEARGEISGAEAKGLAIAQAVGSIPDTIGEGFMMGLKQIDDMSGGAGSRLLASIGDTPQVQEGLAMLGEGLEKYEQRAEQNPERARRIDAILVPAELALDFIGGGAAKGGAKTAVRQAGEMAAKRGTRTAIQQGAKLAPEGVTFIDKVVSQITKLDPQTVRTIKDDKGLILLGDAQGWNKDNIVEYALESIGSKKDMFGEAGTAYKAIRESAAQVDSTAVKNRVMEDLKKNNITVGADGSLTFPPTSKFTKGDQAVIKEAVEPFLQVDGVISADDFLNMRQRITKAAAFDANVTKTKDATDYIKGLRKSINDVGRDMIPGLKEADDVYVRLVDGLDDVERLFYTKAGDTQLNIDNKLRNILKQPASNPQRQALLKAIPDIEDRMKYLGVSDDIARSAGNKTAAYTQSIAGLALGTAAFGPIGTVGGLLLGAYLSGGEVLKKILLRGGSSKAAAEALAKKVATQQKLLDNEKKMIQEAIQKATATPSPTSTPVDDLPRPSDLKVSQPSAMLKAPDADLMAEARKYKSAEEFVKNQNVIYRGGSSEGMYYTTDKSIAEEFAKNRGGVVKEYVLPKGVKKIDYNDVPGVEFKDIDNYTVGKYALPRKKTILDFMENDLEKDYTKATKWAKDNGYDIITFPTEGEVRTIGSNIVKEKSQLNKIREEANKK